MCRSIEFISKEHDFYFESKWYEYSSIEHFWHKWRASILNKMLTKTQCPLKQYMKFLDIGSGNGIISSILENYTPWSIDQADLNKVALSNSPTTRGRKLYYNILEENKELLESYDGLILFDVLEHIEDPKQFLESCLKHLRKDGYLLINVPAIQCMYSKYDQSMGHIRRYNKKKLIQTFDCFSVKILSIEYWGFFLIPVLAARTAVIKIKGGEEMDIVKFGFSSPVKPINTVMKILSEIERIFPFYPPLGTSLMLMAQKKN